MRPEPPEAVEMKGQGKLPRQGVSLEESPRSNRELAELS